MNEDFLEGFDAQTTFNFKIWKKLAVYFKPYYPRIRNSILMMSLVCVIDVAFPILMKFAVDNFISAGDLSMMLPYCAGYLFLVAIQTWTTFYMTKNSMSIEMLLGKDLKRASFVHLQELGLSYYNQNAVGWLLARVMSDTERITSVIAWALTELFWSMAYIVFSLGAMMLMDWRLGAMLALLMPVLVFATSAFRRKLLVANRIERAANARITAAYNEGITGAKTSKTLVIEKDNNEQFKEYANDLYKASFRNTRSNAIFQPLITFATALSISTVLMYGGAKTLFGAMEIGTLSVFISYATATLEPIQWSVRLLANFVSTQASIERFNSLIETEPDIVDTPGVVEKYGDLFEPKKENWEPIKGKIEFRNVTFKYPDGDDIVLENFNLVVPAGKNVAIVGETGAGKSTLANLACRFYEPTEGQVLIDDVDIRERSQLWLHSQLGYVLQDPLLFSGTIEENIRFGKLDATQEEVVAAAKLVYADSVAERQEDGYQTEVGEGGSLLSTGEKQLISLARAVIADPPIIILDEATSSIDTHTEKLIQNAISTVLSERTSLVVAHRLSTIRNADFILVVSAGKIIEQGAHSSLMEQKGAYYSLYKTLEIEDSIEKQLKS
ncbi:MAG: ABC transporter ATP-binding protein/permease [Eubacteriaceae bacterium]|nr:ABC transporter ATP-binding protein/permease [Eubacteriaceae bacterium]